MSESVESAVQRGAAFLIAQQKSDGNFEGRLSSSTFPTCAYAWAQFAQNQVPDGGLIDWFLKNQNGDGTWGLDAANQPNREATLFAKLILAQFAKRNPNPQIAAALARIPEYPLELALMKLAYAAFGEYDWNKLTIPKNMLPLMKLTQQLLTIFPSLRSLLKPPTNVLPPVDLFNTPMFEKLFIAEQHTLVPVFILIELHTAQRPAIIDSLVSWLKSHRLADGSWFRVNYITALSVLALIELQRAQGRTSCQLVSEEIQAMIDRGIEWLQSTRNPDGGCREALNLNVWDTALSVISIIDIGDATWHNEIQSACRWLIENQNSDGGWAFSGLPPPPSTGGNHRLSLGGPPWGTGGLPSDADDTALATLALLRSKIPSAAPPPRPRGGPKTLPFGPPASRGGAITGGLNWLKAHQGRNGSWSTYIPGQGDVGCVSITAHAIEALHEVKGMESQISRALRWLKSQMTSDGYWTDVWLAKRTYGTACAIIGLIKAGDKASPEMERGVRWLENAQNSDGGWGEDMFGNRTDSTVEQTAWCTYALLLVNRENRSAQRGSEFLLNRQKPDGSWDASCVGIYWEIIGGYTDPIYAWVFPLLALNQFLKGAS